MTRVSTLVFIALFVAPMTGPQAQPKMSECPNVRDSFPHSQPGYLPSFVVTQTGNVLIRPTRSIDEGDRVMVHIITTKTTAPNLRVRRKSAFRPVGTINIAGGTATESDLLVRVSEDNVCDMMLELSDFAPGRAEVEISLLAMEAGASKETSLGTFDFAVQPLYIGAFSLGAIRSTLVDPTFSLIRRGEDSVVTKTVGGDSRVLYTLLYTIFVWGKRDLEKPAKNWYNHVNPSIGVSLKNLSENAFVGITVDLPLGVFLNWGEHAGNVTELDPTAGLSNGSVFPKGPVPTRKRWVSKPYVGVTVDLRAAVKMIKAAANTGVQ